jgi:acetyltransferase-like isoleucine patch superfamily enzyme
LINNESIHAVDARCFYEAGGPVVIGYYACNGKRVTTMPGVSIRYGSVVVPGAVATKNVPSLVIRERSHDLQSKPVCVKGFQQCP